MSSLLELMVELVKKLHLNPRRTRPEELTLTKDKGRPVRLKNSCDSPAVASDPFLILNSTIVF